MLLFSAFLAVAACSRGGYDPPVGMDTPDSGAIPDAAMRMPDLAAVDAAAADAGGLDPATCPVGALDGCCPIGIAFGGHDPDCPSLACNPLIVSPAAPIPLESDWQESGQAGVGMAWTGSELVLAWSSWRNTMTSRVSTIAYQRRDGSGALILANTADDALAGTGSGHSQAELGFEPRSRTLLFTSQTGFSRYGELLAADGKPASQAVFFGATCNPITSRQQVYPAPGRFLVAQEEATCGGAAFRGPRVDLVGTDGKLQSTQRGDTSYSMGMAYDPRSGRVLFTSGASNVLVRFFTPPSSWSTPVSLGGGDTDETAAAFDGTNYAIAHGLYHFDGVGVATTPAMQVWTIPDPPASPSGSSDVTLVSQPRLLQVPPRILWTGDGWLVLSNVYPANGLGLPDSWSQFVTWVSSLAPDGTLRQTFRLDDKPTFLVNAIWAGGRIAVTWVTTDGSRERHYLRWLTCK